MGKLQSRRCPMLSSHDMVVMYCLMRIIVSDHLKRHIGNDLATLFGCSCAEGHRLSPDSLSKHAGTASTPEKIFPEAAGFLTG